MPKDIKSHRNLSMLAAAPGRLVMKAPISQDVVHHCFDSIVGYLVGA